MEEPDERAARDDLAAREDRARRRAEEVTRRESDALVREEALTAREEALAQEELAMRANMAALSARETKLRVREEAAAAEQEAPEVEASMSIEPEPAGPIATSHATDDSMELEPDELHRAALAASRRGRRRGGGDRARARARRARRRGNAPARRGALAASHGGVARGRLRAAPPRGPPSSAHGPSGAPAPSETATLVSGDDVSTRLQVDADGTQPLALLALLRGDSETIARVVLDLRSPEDPRAVLESLREGLPGARGGGERHRALDREPRAGRSVRTVAQRALEVLGARVAVDGEVTAESARLLRDGVASEVTRQRGAA